METAAHPRSLFNRRTFWYDIHDTYIVRFVAYGCRKNLPLSDLDVSFVMTNADNLHRALDNFKDWSNYLLVTTVAAMGWTGKNLDSELMPWAVGVFAVSAALGIGTLALIPLVRERIDTDTASIFDIAVDFNLFWMWPPRCRARLKHACWPQHMLFLLGLVLFAIGTCSGNS